MEFVISALGIARGRTVVDVGAGTGKFTRLLVGTGAHVVAVEPVEAMRSKLIELVPDAEVLDGTGEALALADQSADAITVAQAFHWMSAEPSLAEFARVLRPDGGLGLIWNSRDTAEPWVARLHDIIRWNRGQIPTYDAGDERWIEVVAAAGAFTPVEIREFRLDQELDADSLIDRVNSTSYIATMAADERAALDNEVLALVAGFPQRFVLPYVTFVYWCRRCL